MKKTFLISAFLLLWMSGFCQFKDLCDSTVSFEHPVSFIKIDSSQNNIWQIGEPQKIIFDSAFSSKKAIVTDTINYYSTNCNSSFDIHIKDFCNFNPYRGLEISVEFRHKYDTDKSIDGGTISVSYDQGHTWLNIIKDMNSYWTSTPFENWSGHNLYNNEDLLYNNENGFSGSNSNWMITTFTWLRIPVSPNHELDPSLLELDDMIVRFSFISDSIHTNKEGWLIDNIVLHLKDLGTSIEEIPKHNFIIKPNPILNSAIIDLGEHFNNINVLVYDSNGKLININNYSNIEFIPLNTDELYSGIYFVEIISDKIILGQTKMIVQ